MADIKSYKGKSKSISSSQILFKDYTYDKTLVVLGEMVLNGCQEMMRRKVVTDNIALRVGYSKDEIASTGGSMKIPETTNVYSLIVKHMENLFERTTNKTELIRRLSVTFGNVVDEKYEQYDLLTNKTKVEKEKKIEEVVLKIKDKFGKNSMLRAIDLSDDATAICRNKLIGGHNGE